MRTRNPHGMVALMAGLLLAIVQPAVAQTDQAPSPDPAAREAAESWIATLEAGEYQTSWEEAGEMFRTTLTAEGWAEQAATVQEQIGRATSRELAELNAVTDPPGAPPGDYVHIRYHSDFAVLGSVLETVVLIREEERGWRVIGYFLQPPSEP
jgi:hypothetical protein